MGTFNLQKTSKTPPKNRETGRLIRNRWKMTFLLDFFWIFEHDISSTLMSHDYVLSKNTNSPILHTIIYVRSPASGPGDSHYPCVHSRTRASHWSIYASLSLSPSESAFGLLRFETKIYKLYWNPCNFHSLWLGIEWILRNWMDFYATLEYLP